MTEEERRMFVTQLIAEINVYEERQSNGQWIRSIKFKVPMICNETVFGLDKNNCLEDYENEFISLTDIARYKSDMPHDVVKNWMRTRETIEFLGLWERLHNIDFKPPRIRGV